jgi:alpha-1,2-glucosyltransferase
LVWTWKSLKPLGDLLIITGDKSNHVATIHFPQMLYFWPYLIFFALPLAARSLLSLAVPLLPSSIIPARIREFMGNNGHDLRIPRILSVAFFVALAIMAVHFNTIIHPFTLADNRHYVFYVFRILRRHPAIKYAVIPIYITCASLAIQLLASARNPIAISKASSAKGGSLDRRNGMQPEFLFNSIGFVIVWLATTALSTVTAPLVEPRYFIIPWAIWRIHAHRPSDLRGLSTYLQRTAGISEKIGTGNQSPGYIGWLCLEAMWYLLINLATGYLFLYRGFSWPQEPGNVQRFMW